MKNYLCKVGQMYVQRECGTEIFLTSISLDADRLTKEDAEYFSSKLNGRIVEIKKCQICGEEFVPSKRSDELYCQKCKKAAFNTIKIDDIYYTEYRKTYKTISARAKRHGTSSKIDEWRINAKKEMECRRSKKDFEGFYVWLKDSVKLF